MDRSYWISIIHKYYPNWDVSDMSDKQVAAIAINLLDKHKDDEDESTSTSDETVVENRQLETKDVFTVDEDGNCYDAAGELVADEDIKDYLGKEDKNNDK